MRTTIWQLSQSLLGFAIIHFSNCMQYTHRKNALCSVCCFCCWLCVWYCLLFVVVVRCVLLLCLFVFVLFVLWFVLCCFGLFCCECVCVCKNEGTCFIVTYCLMMFFCFYGSRNSSLSALSQHCFFPAVLFFSRSLVILKSQGPLPFSRSLAILKVRFFSRSVAI